jgi:uncharacterized protein
MKLSRLLIPLLVMTTLMALVHRYVYVRVVRDGGWPEGLQVFFALLLGLLALAIPFSFVAMRTLPRRVMVPFSRVIYTWMGLLFYLFVLSAFADAGKVTASLMGFWPAAQVAQDAALRHIAIGIGGFSIALGVLGMVNVGRGFAVRRVRVPLNKWSHGTEGAGAHRPPTFTIAHLTDIHIGPSLGKKFVDRMVDATLALNADMVVITGDLVDGSVDQLRAEVEPLRRLQARYGVFFVTGNHEYYSGADAWVAHLTRLGIRVLRNEHVVIGGFLTLAGVDDYRAESMLPGHGQDIVKALEGRDLSLPSVLLAHQPKAYPEAVANGVDLMLSGHVHGGQIVPFNWLTRIDQPLVKGLYRRGESFIYVSEGTGFWGPPMRIGTRCEIALLELQGLQGAP